MSCCFVPNAHDKKARQRDKEITNQVKADFKQKQKVIQMLLLGTGESGKSTIRKQMQIIHINGFSNRERQEKIAYMRRNIRDSIACILAAMEKLQINYETAEAANLGTWLLQKMEENKVHNSAPADQDPFDYSDQFFDAVHKLWSDTGVQQSYRKSHLYQLIDCAKYFLDRADVFRDENYLPNDQDILRCRIMTNDISDIEFDIRDGGHNVRFRVFDVGGQKGERKKWIQCFNNVTGILYLCDVSSFDLTLKEDVGAERPKNRLLESLDTFQEVWLNRYLQDVSVLLFINKIDLLEEKVRAGKSLRSMLEFCRAEVQRMRPPPGVEEDDDPLADCNGRAARAARQQQQQQQGGNASPSDNKGQAATKKKKVGPINLAEFVCQLDYDSFEPSDDDKKEFLESFPRMEDLSSSEAQLNGNCSGGGRSQESQSKGKKRLNSQLPSVHEDTVKTACYVKQVLLEIAKHKRQADFKYEYHHHSCCFYYTCAVNTDNVKKVLEGCRAFIIDQHLERFGIL